MPRGPRLNRPDVIEGVHAEMLEAGAEVVETDTFQGSRLKLDEWGLGEHTLEINRGAAEIARRAAGEGASSPARSARRASSPPAMTRPSATSPFRRLVEVFDEQAGALIEGGVDLLIIETQQDILETKAAIFGAREAFKRTGIFMDFRFGISSYSWNGSRARKFMPTRGAASRSHARHSLSRYRRIA